jgi:hypothetical protein
MLPMRVADPSPRKLFKGRLLSIAVADSSKSEFAGAGLQIRPKALSRYSEIIPSFKGIKFYLLFALSLFYKYVNFIN